MCKIRKNADYDSLNQVVKFLGQYYDYIGELGMTMPKI